MNDAQRQETLRELLLTISEVHAGTCAEGEKIVAAVLDAIVAGYIPGVSAD